MRDFLASRTRDVVSVSHDATLWDAALIMGKNGVKRLPVVDHEVECAFFFFQRFGADINRTYLRGVPLEFSAIVIYANGSPYHFSTRRRTLLRNLPWKPRLFSPRIRSPRPCQQQSRRATLEMTLSQWPRYCAWATSPACQLWMQMTS